MVNAPYIGRPLREPNGGLDLIKTIDSGSAASYEFLNGSNDVVLDATYRHYVFEIIAMHPVTDGVQMIWQWSKDGGSSYSALAANTHVTSSEHAEDDSPAQARNATNYYSGTDGNAWASGRSHNLGGYCSNDADSCTSGFLHWFSPYSTNRLPMAWGRISTSGGDDGGNNPWLFHAHTANIIDEQDEAIDGVKFLFSSGNIDTGTIKLYGYRY